MSRKSVIPAQAGIQTVNEAMPLHIFKWNACNELDPSRVILGFRQKIKCHNALLAEAVNE